MSHYKLKERVNVTCLIIQLFLHRVTQNKSWKMFQCPDTPTDIPTPLWNKPSEDKARLAPCSTLLLQMNKQILPFLFIHSPIIPLENLKNDIRFAFRIILPFSKYSFIWRLPPINFQEKQFHFTIKEMFNAQWVTTLTLKANWVNMFRWLLSSSTHVWVKEEWGR